MCVKLGTISQSVPNEFVVHLQLIKKEDKDDRHGKKDDDLH